MDVPSEQVIQAAPPTPTTTLMPEPGTRRSRKGLFVVLAILVVLLGGAGFFAYKVYKGDISLPFLSKPPSLTALAASFKSMRSARLDTTARLAVEKRDPGVKAIDLSAMKKKREAEEKAAAPPVEDGMLSLGPAPSTTDRVTSMLVGTPDDSEISVTVATDWSREGANTDSETTVKGTYSASGVTLAFDLAWRQLASAGYLRVDKIPALLVDFSPIAGTWVKVPKGTNASSFDLFGGMAEDEGVFETTSGDEKAVEEKAEEKPAGVLAEFSEIFSEAAANGAIKVGATDDAATVAGQSAYRMTLSIDPAALKQTVQALYEKRQEKFPGATKFALLNEETLKGWDNDLIAGWTLEVFASKKTKELLAIHASAPFVFDEEDAPKLKDNQIKASVAVEFSKINQPVSIEEPADSISFATALNRVLGRSDDEVKLDQQQSNVSDIRTALDEYKKKNGGYPDTLGALAGFSYKPYGDSEFFSESMKATVKTVVRLPNDLFTAQPFPYTKTEAGYELKYEMRGVEDDPKYIEGTNTATESELSVGAKGMTASFLLAPLDGGSSMEPDSDGDGLANSSEWTIGTDESKKDTDGDGFDDKAELDGGYDPLINAATGEQATVIPTSASRDSTRLAEVLRFQTALALYFADHGAYPSASGTVLLGTGDRRSLCSGGFKSACDDDDTTYAGIVSLAPTPADGECSPSDNAYAYAAVGGGTSYTLTFCLGDRVRDVDHEPGKHTANPDGIQ